MIERAQPSQSSQRHQPALSETRPPGATRPAPPTRGAREPQGSPPPSPETVFWETFVRAHGRELQRCVTWTLWCCCGRRPLREEVEELVQEVYCRLLTGRSGCGALAGRSRPQLWSYLHRLIRSVVVDWLRSRHTRKRGRGWRADGRGLLALAERPAPGLSPEERLLARERMDQLRGRVRSHFPGEQGERYLRVLELSAVEGLTSLEISRQLCGTLTPSSVHTVLSRIRRRLGAGSDRGQGAAMISSRQPAAVG